MIKGREVKVDREMEKGEEKHQSMSKMTPVTQGAYGGGLYGTEEGMQQQQQQQGKRPASDSQSADGPATGNVKLKHKPPPSTGDKDVDITGQSYFQ